MIGRVFAQSEVEAADFKGSHVVLPPVVAGRSRSKALRERWLTSAVAECPIRAESREVFPDV